MAVGLLAFCWSSSGSSGVTTLQLVRHGVRLTGGQDLQSKVGLLIDFAGDQVRKATLATCISRPEFCLCNSCCLFGVCLTQVRKFSQRRLEHTGVDKQNYLHDGNSGFLKIPPSAQCLCRSNFFAAVHGCTSMFRLEYALHVWLLLIVQYG